ncbi:MAG TPA: C25 family cysteine peptidase [Pyrinomonadaceae bacterium]|nr:C25 family cysteine peptidase [Pyrinomonadaceae bacterium]
MFILRMPASGTNTVQVTLNAGVNYAVAGSISFNDVNQVTPTRPFTRSSGSTSPASITVASATNEIVLDTIATRFEAGVLTPDAGQTQRWNGTACDGPPPPTEPNLVLNSVGAGSTEPGATNTTTLWTLGTAQGWAMGAVSIVPLAPTQVELASFDAVAADASGVQLKWETGREVDNLGFNVYREEDGGRVRLNPTLIAGSALIAGQGTPLTAGNSYSWPDAQGTAGSVYWLEDVDLDGTRTWHGPVAAVAAHPGSAAPRQQAKLLSQLSETNGNAAAPVTERPALAPTAAATSAASVAPLTSYQLASRAGVKISVNRAGWYRVTQPELAAAGLAASVDPGKLQLYAEGVEQAVKLVTPSGAWDANAYLEFYGTGLDMPSTDKRTYWLIAGSTAGKRVAAASSPAPSATLARSFPHTVEVRERLLYFSALLNGDGENFFGRVLFTQPLQYVFNVHHYDRNTAPQPALEISLQGVSLQAHSVKVLVNGTIVGTINYEGMENPTARLTIPGWVLREGNNNVKLVAQNGETDTSLVDTVRLTYQHFYKAHSNRLSFTAKGSQTIRAEGFTGANVRVLDVTNPGQPQEVLPQVAAAGSLYSATFKAGAGETRAFVAFTGDLSESPAETKANQPSKWSTASHWADMVVITHGDFRAAIEPLARLRRSQGRLVLVVDVEDVYDEFSYGAHSPAALRDFLSLTRARWSRAPRWVLLVGDGSYDPRNYQGRGQFDFVPTKMVDTRQMETAMDDWFADFDSDAVPEMAVGRLPVQTVTEAERVVAKITGYSPANNAGRGVLLVADRLGADGYDFAADSDALKTYVPGTIGVQSINRTTESADTIRSQIIDGLNQGQILANWVGHGSFERWTGDGVLRIADVPQLSNSGKPAVFVTMTCMNGYYHSNTGDSLAEALMKVENGGAVAVWASSGVTLPTGQSEVNRKLYEHLFAGTPTTLGEAVRQAKAATSDIDVRRTWILFGDPLMRLR